MDNNVSLQQFVDRIMSINSPVINIMGGGIPGMSGSSAATQGSMTSSGEIIYQLKQQTMNFARTYEDKNSPVSELMKLAKLVEGSLLVEETLSGLTQNDANSLIDQLYNLIETRA